MCLSATHGKITIVMPWCSREREGSSIKVLLLLLVLAPRHNPLYFSVQSDDSLIPDPEVKLSLSQNPATLPGPEAILSVISSQALADSFSDLFTCFTRTLVLLSCCLQKAKFITRKLIMTHNDYQTV